jgi:CRP/FNR family transcriptional regulator, cyclic AMP receptor protein
MRIEKSAMVRVLHAEPAFAALFTAYLLSRNRRIEEDLIDHLFNSSEKRLARVLLLLAHFGKEGQTELVIPKISQETLAEMVGTTRSRVSFFLNKFRRLGFIDYNGGSPSKRRPPITPIFLAWSRMQPRLTMLCVPLRRRSTHGATWMCW